MKSILQFAAFVLLAGSIFFSSCSKESPGSYPSNNPPGPYFIPPIQPPDTLAGREFVFDSLSWSYDFDYGVYTTTPARPDLFFKEDRAMEVSIKPATSANWIIMPRWVILWSYPPANNGFLYYYNYGAYLVLISFPSNNQLIGTKASVKVKFL